MTTKFKIFCDEPQPPVVSEKELLSTKREPFGLRQNVLQARPQVLQELPMATVSTATALTTTLPTISASTTSSSSSISSTPPQSSSSQLYQQHQDLDHDQENDISIASLGSDFVPSIIHEEFDSFECEEGNVTSATNELECQANDQFVVDDFDLSVGNCSHDDDDIDFDEATQDELNQALRKHDESVLLNCAVFIDDIVDYLHDLEANVDLRPLPNYMCFHQDIDSHKRAILINWLVEVSDEYELQTETLFICINILDRFLSKMSISISHFQLLGAAAMFIATKYEEIYPPYLHQFVEVTDETFSGKQIIQMEQEILRTLDFRISAPTVIFFLRQIFAFNKFTRQVYNLAEYLCYLSLLADKPFLEYHPSEIALAAVILAAHQLDAAANISSELKKAYDNSNQSQLRRRDASKLPGIANNMSTRDNSQRVVDPNFPFCIESLRAMQEKVSHDSAVYIKFSSEAHDRVACLQPLTVENLHRCS